MPLETLIFPEDGIELRSVVTWRN